MSTVPSNPDDAILWLEDHLDTWGADPTVVGLSELDITEMQAALDAVIAARSETVATRIAAKTATTDYKNAYKNMRSSTSLRIARIRTYARGTANPAAVYSLAEIPAPATPTEAPPPATPYGFKVSLLEGGSLGFSFKCANPKRVHGVTYRVERQDAPQTPYVFLVNAKDKHFEDDAFPNSATYITYRVTSQTSTKDGVPTYFTVRYGNNQQATIVSQGPATTTQAS
jgi:hypothetical protein